MVHLCNSLRTLFIFSFFCIISPPQRLLHNNQRLTFYSWSATVKLSKLIFWLYLLCPSAPWVIWASPRTGVREISNATSKPSIRAQNRKVLCNIRAFRWWCADVSPFWGKRTESGQTHTHIHTVCIATCTNHVFCPLAPNVLFLPTVQIESCVQFRGKSQHETVARLCYHLFLSICFCLC